MVSNFVFCSIFLILNCFISSHRWFKWRIKLIPRNWLNNKISNNKRESIIVADEEMKVTSNTITTTTMTMESKLPTMEPNGLRTIPTSLYLTPSNEPPKRDDEYVIDFIDILQSQSDSERIEMDRHLAVKILKIVLVNSGSSGNTSGSGSNTPGSSYDSIDSPISSYGFSKMNRRSRNSRKRKLKRVFEQLRSINRRMERFETHFGLIDLNNNNIEFDNDKI